MESVSARLIVAMILEAHEHGFLDGLLRAEHVPLSGEGEGNAAHLRDSIKQESDRLRKCRQAMEPHP